MTPDLAVTSGSDRDSVPSSSKAYVPPMGSFVRRTSRRQQEPPVGPPAITPSPPPPKSRKTHTPSPRVAIPKGKKSPDSNGGNPASQNPFSANGFDYIPPTGSFNLRKPNRDRASTPTREALLKDIELAARAQSMFAQDSLLASSASNLSLNLNASLGSIDFNASQGSAMDFSTTKSEISDKPRAGKSQGGRRAGRPRTPTGGDVYILPTIESLPPASPAKTSKSLSSWRRSSSKPAAADSDSDDQRPLVRHNSVRSWDGDLDLQDPMAKKATADMNSPMWASLSALNHDYLPTVESGP